jgi:hypothetical protein
MALSEFLAIETAYRVLAPLDPAARVRALGWLSGALNAPGLLPGNPAEAGGPKRARASSSAKPTPAAAPETPKRTRATAKKTAAAAPARKGKPARKTSAPAQPRSRASKTTKTVKAASAGAERAYRRMPPADDVLGAYRQVGTISGLAEHFGVPTHTVQGWARRLRREGHDIGRNA